MIHGTCKQSYDPHPKVAACENWKMLSGVALISRERDRQVSKEGFTPEHDDEHVDNELTLAALCYLEYAEYQVGGAINSDEVPKDWPWEADLWKPSPDPVRNLVKAGALLAAETDRLQRIELAKLAL